MYAINKTKAEGEMKKCVVTKDFTPRQRDENKRNSWELCSVLIYSYIPRCGVPTNIM